MDVRETGDGAVVHEDVAAEDEGVAVDLCDDTTACGTDVGEETIGLGIDAETSEVEVVDGRGLGLLEGWSWTVDVFFVVRSGIGVPSCAEAVHVEEAVAQFEEVVLGVVKLVLLAIGKELRQVVLGALLGDGVCGVDEHVGEETRLLR